MESILSPFLFYLMAMVIIVSGLGMAISSNLFHSAMWMLMCFLGVAGLYASMQEHFMAIVQILVYVGAITILVIFGLMLTNAHTSYMKTNPLSSMAALGALVASSLCILLSVVIRTLGYVPAEVIQVPAIRTIGVGLFGVHILATELAAVLLLVGMIGAVVIARKGEEK